MKPWHGLVALVHEIKMYKNLFCEVFGHIYKICTNENFQLYDNSLRWLDIHHKLRINSSKALAWILHASTCISKRYLTVTTQATKQLSFLVDQQQGYWFLQNNRRPSNGGTHVQLAADFDTYSTAHSYSTVHVKGKHYKSVSRGRHMGIPYPTGV